MQDDLAHYKYRKQRRRKIIVLLIISLLASATALFVRDCSQSLDEPYNKDYTPLDKSDLSTLRDLS